MSETKIFDRNSRPDFGGNQEAKLPNPCKLKFQFANKENGAYGICSVYDFDTKKNKQLFMKDFNAKTKMTFLFMDEKFFMNGFHDETKGGNDKWYGSTDYRLASEEVAVFENGVTKPVFVGTKKEAANRFPFMSVGVYVWAYLVEKAALVKIQLTASGRQGWFEFKEKQGEKPLNFTIQGFTEVMDKKFKTKKQADIPVFTPVEATEKQNKEADLHFTGLAEFTGRIKFLEFVHEQQEAAKQKEAGNGGHFPGDVSRTSTEVGQGNGEPPTDDLPF